MYIWQHKKYTILWPLFVPKKPLLVSSTNYWDRSFILFSNNFVPPLFIIYISLLIIYYNDNDWISWDAKQRMRMCKLKYVPEHEWGDILKIGISDVPPAYLALLLYLFFKKKCTSCQILLVNYIYTTDIACLMDGILLLVI